MKAGCLIFLVSFASGLCAQLPPLSVEEEVMPKLRYYTEKANDQMVQGNGQMAYQYRDSIRIFMVGKSLTAAYLEDREGQVWNLGVMDQPYIMHTIHSMADADTPGFREMADNYAEQVLTFLVTTPPRNPEEEATLTGLGDNIVVVFEEDPRLGDGYSADNRLLGLIGYPATYFVGIDRKIVGVIQDWRQERAPGNEGEEERSRAEAAKHNSKKMQKATDRLLQGKKIRH